MLAPHRRPRTLLALGLAALVALPFAGCSSDDGGAPGDDGSPGAEAPARATEPIVFNGQGNNLDAYAVEPGDDGTFATQRVFETRDTDPDAGRDINAQICFFPPAEDGERWFIAGEDTNQDDPGGSAGWGIFRLDGDRIGELEATQLGKLVPTYQPANDNPENYGCAVLSDGRVLTTDVGNQAVGDGDGQLIVWFPPLVGGEHPEFPEVAYCKIDVGLPTAQSILLKDDDEVYVAASRAGVFRYRGPFPTSPDAAGGCGNQDATGAPMADEVDKELFIASGENGMITPAGLAPAPDGGLYVSSVFTGVIDEYDADGTFRRTILQPPEGESLGEETFSTGTPLGIGVAPDGTLFYADIGVVVTPHDVGPGDRNGSVRRIRFVDGEPQPPETLAVGLAFPDGIGIFDPAA
ncbi:MAG: hypothetical protein R2702_15140 [Acidimicrobiales bacterium]